MHSTEGQRTTNSGEEKKGEEKKNHILRARGISRSPLLFSHSPAGLHWNSTRALHSSPSQLTHHLTRQVAAPGRLSFHLLCIQQEKASVPTHRRHLDCCPCQFSCPSHSRVLSPGKETALAQQTFSPNTASLVTCKYTCALSSG